MTIEEKAKAYDEALEKAGKELKACGNMDCDAARQIFRFFPELREKPLTPFQQCLNCILRGVYYAEVPYKEVKEFILKVVRTRTDELVELAKKHEYTDCQLHESDDERIREKILQLVSGDISQDDITDYENRQMRDWLKKQKEPHYIKRNPLFDKCVEKCDPKVMQEVSNKVDEMLGKEQKPISSEDMPYVTDEHFYEREQADSFKYRLAEYMTKNCIREEGEGGYAYKINSESILEMAKEELIKRGELQKPAWSEEDKKILDDVSHILIGLNYKQIAKDYKQAVEKLIYARSSWKPSELEKGALRTAIHILTDERSFPKAAKQLQNILDAFDGKESRKDWKPTEEQMEALYNVFYTCSVGAKYRDILAELYEQLKKL